MKGIILHAGHGTRLRPLTYGRPKQLLPIANCPMSQYGLELLKKSGVNEIAIIIGGNNANKVKEFYGDGEKFGVKISYIFQDYPKGISHAIGLCEKFVGDEKFIVFLGDNILIKDISSNIKEFEKSDSEAKIFLCEVANPSQFGIADVKDGKVKKIMEKPKEPPTNLAVIGVYLLTPKIFKIIKNLKPSWRNELEITDALQILLEEENEISYDIITNYWKDTGTIEDIIDANNILISEMEPYFYGEKIGDVELNGKVIVGKKSQLLNKTTITGPVLIGNNSNLGINVKIGPNVSIGDNCILENCEIENSIIMDNCKISGIGKISNSIISYNSKITKENNSSLIICEDSKIELV